MASSYSIIIKNAPIGSVYSMFMDGSPNCIAGGKADNTTYVISVPNEYQGNATIKVNIPTKSRDSSVVVFPISFKATGGNHTFDINELLPIYVPQPAPKTDAQNTKLLQNDLKRKVQAKKKSVKKIAAEIEESKPVIKTKPKKKYLQHELRDEMQDNNVDSEDESENNESDDPKKSFWDRLK
ncbi:hypothetical protein A2W32_01820 [candidate division WWE3 bacterium RBG_16_37_10]|uniref:Uncharacterized protein n=1 Tax=candidate division WWE3 bacterium RBG_16_37_10 TaxID=1802610 RepID=A0A1F4UW78_UNCKA|nr:MAG: hypothetical protein A2W32_01820 [candidate division WWE3 bacterium RBG_16_37_10]